VLPRGVEAVSGKKLTDESMSTVTSGFISMVRLFLLVFAAVALLVGTLNIHNTFAVERTMPARSRVVAGSALAVIGAALVLWSGGSAATSTASRRPVRPRAAGSA
jgi:hypothetical protein